MIGVCTKCHQLYDFGSEEAAYEPDRVCGPCYRKAHGKTAPVEYEPRVMAGSCRTATDKQEIEAVAQRLHMQSEYVIAAMLRELLAEVDRLTAERDALAAQLQAVPVQAINTVTHAAVHAYDMRGDRADVTAITSWLRERSKGWAQHE